MWRVVWFVPTLLGILAFAGTAAHSQEWGFSSPKGAVVNVFRDSSLNVSGTLALPSKAGGSDVKIPVAGRNEPGKLILEFDDPETGVGKTVTYQRGKSSDGAYTVWQADNAPEAFSELRAPINASGELAKMALESWNGDTDAVVAVETFTQMMEAYRAASPKPTYVESADAPVAIVTDRPSAAAWDGAASRIGTNLTSVQTFSRDGVLFTMNAKDLIAALNSQADLLQTFGGLAKDTSVQRRSAVIPVATLPNFQRFWVPLVNMFDTYAVENSDPSRIEGDLEDLFVRLRGHSFECGLGEASNGSFSVGCLHHSKSHNLRGEFLVNTIFSFGVGVLRDKDRQIFMVADSWAAAVKESDKIPGQDRFTYHRSSEPAVESAHGIAVAHLRAELGKMFKGFRSN